jgi:hypothetical protein
MSAIWSEYLNQFYYHKFSETPLFLHIQQDTESSFISCISFVYLHPERRSGKKSFILVPIFFVLLFFVAHEYEYRLFLNVNCLIIFHFYPRYNTKS